MCGTETLGHRTCNSAKRTLAGACVKCYGLLVETRVLSSIATPIRMQGFAEHVELGLMLQAGLTPLQAISVATKNGAKPGG